MFLDSPTEFLHLACDLIAETTGFEVRVTAGPPDCLFRLAF
jgi:hypothetical protein